MSRRRPRPPGTVEQKRSRKMASPPPSAKPLFRAEVIIMRARHKNPPHVHNGAAHCVRVRFNHRR